MKNLLVDKRWFSRGGIGRYSEEILKRIGGLNYTNPKFSIFHPFEQFYLLRLLKKRKPDIYFTPGINPPVFWNGIYIFTVHDLIPIEFKEEVSLSKRIYFKTVLKTAIKKAPKVLTVSEFTKKEILRWTGVDENKIVVIYNGVSDNYHPQVKSYNPGFPYLFYVGNKRPHKNIKSALLAYAMSDFQKDVKFILSGSPTCDLKETIAEYSLEDKVVFEGFISEKNIPSYYKGAEALLFPSLYEGFGLPALEAMACGTPVITSNVTALPEITGNAACFVNPYDIVSITRGINKTLSDTSYREDLKNEGIKRAKVFDWDKSANQLKKIFDSLV